MIIFVYGTTAEAIKLAPIARRLDALGIPYQHWVTQQHTDALRLAMPQLGFREPDRVLANGWRGQPLKTPLQMLGWIFDVGFWSLRNARHARRALPQNTVVIVHGDTVTTVLGTILGRLMRFPVAHVEAGLRSGNWRHPFPEELDRRIVGRLAQFHYAPSKESVANLAGRRDVVHTEGNTVKDAVLDSRPSMTADAGASPYGLVLLHRFEFISNASLVATTLRTIDDSTDIDLRVVVDSYSRDMIEAKIAELGLDRFKVMPKLEHSQFVDLLRNASLIVTDSGGIQEESAVFGIPTLVHRMATERSEGLGSSAVLSRWDMGIVRHFLTNVEDYRVTDAASASSPSDIIVADLIARGFAAPRITGD